MHTHFKICSNTKGTSHTRNMHTYIHTHMASRHPHTIIRPRESCVSRFFDRQLLAPGASQCMKHCEWEWCCGPRLLKYMYAPAHTVLDSSTVPGDIPQGVVVICRCGRELAYVFSVSLYIYICIYVEREDGGESNHAKTPGPNHELVKVIQTMQKHSTGSRPTYFTWTPTRHPSFYLTFPQHVLSRFPMHPCFSFVSYAPTAPKPAMDPMWAQMGPYIGGWGERSFS